MNMRHIATSLLILLILAVGCGPAGPKNVRIDPAFLALVPPDTVALAGAQLDELSETPLYRKLLSTGTVNLLEQFIAGTGIDPSTDLWELLAVSNGADSFLMLRGKFSESGMEPRLEFEGAERGEYRGYLMIADEDTAILFINSTTAIVGKPEVLKSVIDGRDKYTGLPAPLLEKLDSLEPGNQIWAVSLGGAMQSLPADAGNFASAVSLLQRIQGLTIAVNLSDGMVFVAKGECSSAEDAETLQSALQGLIGFARLGFRDRPALTAIIDVIKVDHQDLVVEVRADVPAELMEKVLSEPVPQDAG